MTGFSRAGGTLLCDGVSLEAAAAAHGTPLYVYSRDAIVEAYRSYEAAFASVPHRICYSVKANGSGAILRLMASLGAGADIVSGLELRAALRAGFAPDHVVFSGVGKTDEEMAAALDAGIGEFNAESEDEIARLSALAAARGRRAGVTLRVNPDIDARSHPYISTGLRDNKFGVDIGAAPGILARARERPGIDVAGVQCHIGSQIRSLEPMTEAVAALVDLTRRLLSEGYALRTIDIGGGLGVNYEEGTGPEVAAFAAGVLPHLRGLGLTVLLEPGRSLVARAGTLLTGVLYVKESHGKRFVIVDAGMNDLLRPALYKAFHRIEPVAARGRPSRQVDVVGPVCETADAFARDRELETVEPGELLAIRDAGAYGFVMASTYNMRPRPAEVMVEDGGVRLIRRRETFDDLIATEV
ncbi:MAG TPA: diaminopimelate decarboxylase [Vicinamibacteria bacterium]|nr:diaminopimelate decarboxylase [Vicinamibacteria bacterium]